MKKIHLKKTINRSRSRKGFSLAEVMVVVAILGILTSLGFVAVNKYKRDLTGLEMDASAKELFIAAQNHLSLAESQALLDKDSDSYGWSANGNTESDANGVYWFLVGDAPATKAEGAAGFFTSTPDDRDSILSLMVPAGSIEDTIRTQGSYIIRYQKNPAQVLDVFFAEKDGDYPYTFTAADYDTLMNFGNFANASNYRENAKLRRNYGESKAVIGYFGGTAAVDVATGKELKSPVLYLNEGNILSVVIQDPNPSNEPHNLYITFSGETSGQNVTIPLLVQNDAGTISITENSTTFPTDPKYKYIKDNIDKIIKYNKNDGTFTFILDDITEPGLHFAEIFGGTGLIPGEKINIQAEANNNAAFTNVAKSNVVSTYVLFDDIDKDTGEIEVSNIRQLENLDPSISGFDPTTLKINPTDNNSIDVKQTESIDFDDFLEDIRNEKKLPNTADVIIYEIDDDLNDEIPPKGSTPNTFNPIDPNYHMDYDGENNIISNVVVNTNGDAGLFGSLSEPSNNPNHITVKDVELVDFDVTSTDGNAGVLAGTLTNANITGVMVHNSSSDPNHGVIAGNNAGGLVGQMNGGSADLCSASTFVQSTCPANSATNDGNAGGLIGKVTDTITVTNCYAGGHTKDARYQKDTTGAYRINVQGNNSAGGFIGNAKQQEVNTEEYKAKAADLTVRYCYSTCSVKGGTSGTAASGGFIGSAGSAKVQYSYAAGKVYPTELDDTEYKLAATGAVSPFIGSTGSGSAYSNNGFLMGVCDSAKSEPTAKSYSAKDYAATGTFVRDESSRNTATTFDKTLTARFNGKYTFATLSQLNTGLTGLSGVSKKLATTHFGDWQYPNITALKGKLTNADVLSFEFQLEDSTRQAVLAITGENSGKTVLLLFDIETDGSVALAQMGSVTNATAAPEIGDIVWDTSTSGLTKFHWSKGNSTIESGKKSITVILDDITEPFYHFAEIFKNTGLIPGEDISVRIASGLASWGEICNMLDPDGSGQPAKAHKANSLFARSDENRTTFDPLGTKGTTLVADITHVRHLQNLDARVSSVTNKVKRAVMYGDATWSSTTYDKIYNADSSKNVVNSIIGISNSNITEFNGQNHSIKNLIINGYADGYSSIAGNSNVGLFRSVANNLTIKQVCMENCLVNGFYAGGYIGIVDGAKNYTVTFDSVLFVGSNASVNGGLHTGGLIGSEENGLGVTITNCGVSAPVHGVTHTGGFIGYAQGNVLIENSYVGGQTQNGVYQATEKAADQLTAADFNIYSSESGGYFTGAVGGFIGRIRENGLENVKLTIHNSFSAASIGTSAISAVRTSDNRTVGYYAGGIVGDLDIDTEMTNVYTIAPVRFVKVQKTDPVSNSGAFIGNVNNRATTLSNCFYLPEIYKNVTIDSDTNTAPDLKLFATNSGSVTGTVEVAYYSNDKNTIAAKSDKANSMQQKTTVYDATLKRDNMTFIDAGGVTRTLGTREYPFSIWTSFAGKRTYYGDWQPVLNDSTVILYVQFAYDLPNNDGSGFVTTNYTGSTARQEIFKNQENILNTPAVKNFANYTFKGWRIDGDETSTLLQPKNRTSITIPREFCNNDSHLQYNPESGDSSSLRLVATYEKDPDYVIEFLYDGSLASYDPDYTGGTASISYSTIKVLYSDPAEGSPSHLAYNELAVPTKDIPGYTFLGWYSDKACTQMINFNSSAKITSDITAYAKYEKIVFIDIKVNFMYLATGSTTEASIGLQPLTLQLVHTGSSITQTVPLDSSLQGLTVKEIKYVNGDNEIVNISQSGGSVSASVADNKLTFTTSKSTEYYITFSGTNSSLKEYSYTIIHRLHNTDKYGNYSSNNSDIYNNPVLGTYKGLEGSFTSAPISEEEGFLLPSASDVSNIIISSDTTKNVVTIDYYRKPGFVTFNTMGGTYLDVQTVTSGENLNSSVGSTNPTSTRTGYTLSGWAIHDLGDPITSEKYSWEASDITLNHTMPANNLEAVARWEPANTNYTVAFWYEDADSDDLTNVNNYTFAGSIRRTAKTATIIDGTNAKNYFGITPGSISGHSHSLSCYPGATTQQVTTKTEGSSWNRVTNYYLGNDRVSLSSTSTGNGKVVGYKYGSSYGYNATPDGKLICINNTWYVYTGSTAVGSTAPCEYVPEYTWIDKDHFTYNNLLTEHSVTVKGDGSTVVNVYFYRNTYSLYFYWENAATNFTHTHTDDCYTYMCNNNHSVHTAECLSCALTEHTHGTDCNIENCTVGYEHTHGSSCNIENCTVGYEHTHGTNCNIENCTVGYEHTHGTNCNVENCTVGYEHTHGTNCNIENCTVGYEHTHGDGSCNLLACPTGYEHTHTASCYGGCSHTHDVTCQGLDTGTPANQALNRMNSTTNNSIKEDYVYYYHASSNSGYWIYHNGTWYKANDDLCTGNTVWDSGFSMSWRVRVYAIDQTYLANHCNHVHNNSCLNCGKVEHTHSSACCSKTAHVHSSACCSLTAHTHTAACCSLTAHAHTSTCCSLTAHTHNAACCSLTAHTHDATCCSLTAHTHDATCYQNCPYGGVHQHTADCSKVLTCTEYVAVSNEKTLYYNSRNWNLLGVIRAKYNAPIKAFFPVKNQNTSWKCTTSDYSYVLLTIDRMPGKDLKFVRDTDSRTYNKYAYYYCETLNGAPASSSGGENNKSISGVIKNYDLYKTVIHGFSFITRNEEIHPIEGFTSFAVNDYNSMIDLRNSTQTEFHYNSDAKKNYIYYTRNSYALQYVVDGADYNKYTYQYESPLTNANITPTRPSTIPSDYIFSGWYKDPDLTNKFDFANSTMPAGLSNGDTSLVIYGKWLPPQYDIRFFKDATFAEEYTYLRINNIYRYENIGDKICKTNGELNDSYKPMNGELVLEGWYYKDGNVEKPFVAYQGIVGNVSNTGAGNDYLYVYAKWRNATSTTTSTVTVRYLDENGNVLKDASGHFLVDRSGAEVKEYTVNNVETGTLYSVPARSISGYFSMQAVGSCAVTTDADRNIITFNYKKAETWNYKVEYYARYTNYKDPSTLSYQNLSLSNDVIELEVGSETVSTDLQYCTVLYQTPEGYSNYHMTGYEVVYSTGSTTDTGMSVTISNTGTTVPTVKFFIEPDGDAVDFATGYTKYDGLKHNLVVENSASNVFTMPGSGITARLEYYYNYDGVDNNGQALDAINAGTYLTDGYIVMVINDGTADHRYLLFADENNNSTLVIERRNIFLKSQSGEWEYDGNVHTIDNPLTDIIVTGDGWATATNEGAEYVFTVESFRMERGSTYNTFSYTLKPGTLASNYRISVDYGMLTVY